MDMNRSLQDPGLPNSSLSHEEIQEIISRLTSGRAQFDVVTQSVLVLSFGSLIALGAAGNLLVCLSVLSTPTMRSPRNLLILNLSLSDLTLCLFVQPSNLLKVWTPVWRLGKALCKLVPMISGTNVFVSTLTITVIALDRFQLIVHPTDGDLMKSWSAAALALIWTLALLMASPTLVFSTTQSMEPVHGIVLYEVCLEAEHLHYFKVAYSIGSVIVQYILPILIVSIAHARICCKLRGRMKSLTTFSVPSSDERRDRSRAAPSPVTPLPVTSSPVTPVTQLPVTSSPVRPLRVTSSPVTPVPVTSSSVTPVQCSTLMTPLPVSALSLKPSVTETDVDLSKEAPQISGFSTPHYCDFSTSQRCDFCTQHRNSELSTPHNINSVSIPSHSSEFSTPHHINAASIPNHSSYLSTPHTEQHVGADMTPGYPSSPMFSQDTRAKSVHIGSVHSEQTYQPAGRQLSLPTSVFKSRLSVQCSAASSSPCGVVHSTSASAARNKILEARARRERRTNLLLVSIALVFAASWMPLNIVNLIADIDPTVLTTIDGRGLVFAVAQLLALVSACANPVLYGWLNDNFRQRFRVILCLDSKPPCFSSRRRPASVSMGSRSNRTLVGDEQVLRENCCARVRGRSKCCSAVRVTCWCRYQSSEERCLVVCCTDAQSSVHDSERSEVNHERISASNQNSVYEVKKSTQERDCEERRTAQVVVHSSHQLIETSPPEMTS